MILCSEVKHSITAFHVVRGDESVVSRLEGTIHRKRLSGPRVKPRTGQATGGCDGSRDVSDRILTLVHCYPKTFSTSHEQRHTQAESQCT